MYLYNTYIVLLNTLLTRNEAKPKEIRGKQGGVMIVVAS